MDYIYKKSGAIFNAHSYWTKQPVDVVRLFIKQYTKPGETVLDAFCGTGMTGVASIMDNRKFICSDISYVCKHIAKGYCTKYDINNLNTKISNLLRGLADAYEVTCPICGRKNIMKYCILEDTLEKTGKLTIKKIVSNCECSSEKLFIEPSEIDYRRLNNSSFRDFFYPTSPFFGQEPKRNYKRGIFQVYQLYSPRNMSVLAELWDRINMLDDNAFKTLCRFAFTSILFNCSLLSRYSKKYENTKIKMGTYFIPNLIKDNNVVESFRRKIESIMKSNDEIFGESCKASGIIQIDDATKLSKVKSNSVDYIYVDPPYSDILNYAELNIVYESWLGKKTNSNLEMIVSKAENKTIVDYSNMFSCFLKNAYRVLKDKKHITIIFHNANIEHWSFFQKVLSSSKFIPCRRSTPSRLVSKSKTSSQLTTNKQSQCFLAFTLLKDKSKTKKGLKELTRANFRRKLCQLDKEALKKGYKTKSDRYDYIINALVFSYFIIPDVMAEYFK